jgi:hypothetical protein
VSRRDAPTLAQLLNLADRAEDGRLSPAEAARLREGLRHLARGPRRPYRRDLRTQHGKQIAALARIITAARTRGAKTVPVWVLAQVLAEPVQPKEPAA